MLDKLSMLFSFTDKMLGANHTLDPDSGRSQLSPPHRRDTRRQPQSGR